MAFKYQLHIKLELYIEMSVWQFCAHKSLHFILGKESPYVNQ